MQVGLRILVRFACAYFVLCRDLFSKFHDDELGKNHTDYHMVYVLVSLNRGWTNFTFMWPYIVTNFFVIKPIRCTNSISLFCHETLHISDSSSVHHQEFFPCTLSNGVCHISLWQLSSRTILVLLESCLQTCMPYTIAECTVNKLLMTDRRTVRNM
jgi:hypothetical protein